MSQNPREKPIRIRSPRGARVTEIDWADGHKGIYPHDQLRGYCPCAGCQGHSGEINFIPADGHSSGIYSFRYLRSLCRCPECATAKAALENGKSE